MFDLILKNVARFIELTPEETDYFTSILITRHIPKKEYLVKEGDYVRYQGFVNSGCLRTFFVDPKGVEHNVQFAIEDWWTGDMHGFLTQKPARYNIVAIEDTEMLCFDRQAQEELYVRIPKFERFFRHLLQNAFIAQQERIIANLSETAEERYLNFRKKYPKMDKRIPQNQIASFLGITPESLSRIRRQLARKKERE